MWLGLEIVVAGLPPFPYPADTERKYDAKELKCGKPNHDTDHEVEVLSHQVHELV